MKLKSSYTESKKNPNGKKKTKKKNKVNLNIDRCLEGKITNTNRFRLFE